MEDWLRGDGGGLTGSELLVVEVLRTCHKVDPGAIATARALLRGVELLPLSRSLLDAAATLTPPGLRSLDAVHLASALSVREHVSSFVAYDRRLLEAAADAGLPVISPG